jgi:hypothetical protein
MAKNEKWRRKKWFSGHYVPMSTNKLFQIKLSRASRQFLVAALLLLLKPGSQPS